MRAPSDYRSAKVARGDYRAIRNESPRWRGSYGQCGDGINRSRTVLRSDYRRESIDRLHEVLKVRYDALKAREYALALRRGIIRSDRH